MYNELKKGYSFGDFELDVDRRLLLKEGAPVSISPKAFDLLFTLVEHHGQTLSKNDLLDKVWENQFVEENNLTVHVAALRRALGETRGDHKFIVTVPGKGYRFVGEPEELFTSEIVVESREIGRLIFEEEIQVDSDSSAVNQNFTEGPATTLAERQRSSGFFRSNQAVALAMVAAISLAAIGGGYTLRGRLFPEQLSAPSFVRHSARQLTTNGKVGLAALSPDGKHFAYTIDDLGQKSLWLGYVDGGNHLQLSEPAEVRYRGLTFSPDSSHLYFLLRDEKNPQNALYKMPVMGGARTKLLDGISNFSLSPDGTEIAFAHRDNETKQDVIGIGSLDGSVRRNVASFEKGLTLLYDTISWSPDGTGLAVSTIREDTPYTNIVAVLQIADGKVMQIEHESLRQITRTAWLRDGSGLIITGIEPQSQSSVPHYRLWHLALASGELTQITTDRSNYGESWHNDAGATLGLSATSDLLITIEHRQWNNVWVAPAGDLNAAKQITFSSFGKYDGLWGMDWTPDGRLIYTTSDTQSQFISRMNLDGSEQTPLTPPGVVDSCLRVTNDGRYIVFHSNRAGGFDIWRVDIDGSNPLQLTFGGQGFQPAPSPDGRWVYYKSFSKGIGQLTRISIDGGEPESLNENETSWMSFSPDGRHFAASYLTDKTRLAIFSAETNEIIRQFEFPKTGTLFMGSSWTPDGRAVTYRDAAYGYWTQPIDGGEATRLEGFPKEKLYNMSWSKDGKWFAFVRGQESRDVVLLQDSQRSEPAQR